MTEDALAAILKIYDGNEDFVVHGNNDTFPKYMRFSHKEIFNKLRNAGLIASYLPSLGGWSAYLTPNAISYFEEKNRILRRDSMMFRKLPSNSKALLKDLVASENPLALLSERFSKCSHKEDNELRSLLRELIEEGYISIPSWADNKPYYIEINNSARTYDEREAEFERQQMHSVASTTTNFYGDAANIQIQQNTSNSIQSMNVSSELDFDKVLETFEHILSNLSSFNLSTEDEHQLEDAVNEALPMVKAKTNVPFIKKTLPIIKDILLRTTSSLAASGILYMLSQIGV